MFFTSLTPRNDIGGNCYLLELGESRIVLDCGLHPKEIGRPALPQIDALGYDTIDTFFLSHAHLDHLGAVPVLLQKQPSAQVLMSESTKQVAGTMLHNSVHVMKAQRMEKGITEFPFFTHGQVDRLYRQWQPVPLEKAIPTGNRDEVLCELHHAGHVLGATAASFRYGSHTVLYTGDLLFDDQAIVKGAKLPTEGIDTLIIETTSGDTPTPEGYTRKGEAQRLARYISACPDRGGAVLLPVFALGETQEILVLLHQMKASGEIPDMPIFIGAKAPRSPRSLTDSPTFPIATSLDSTS